MFADSAPLQNKLLLVAAGGRSARIPLALRTGPTSKESASPQKNIGPKMCVSLSISVFFEVHPGKLTWNPNNGGLEDDFPFQTGDVQVPANNFPGCSFCFGRSLASFSFFLFSRLV